MPATVANTAKVRSHVAGKVSPARNALSDDTPKVHTHVSGKPTTITQAAGTDVNDDKYLPYYGTLGSNGRRQDGTS